MSLILVCGSVTSIALIFAGTLSTLPIHPADEVSSASLEPTPISRTPMAPETSTTPSTPSTPLPEPETEVVDPRPQTESQQLLSLLSQVRTVKRRGFPGGYERSCSPGDACVFGPPWTDDSNAPMGRNGCDTRNDVLRTQLDQVVLRPNTNGCVVHSGTLNDLYTGKTINFVRGFETSRAIEIDHIIPLAAAWDLGASEWPYKRRVAFANDTEYELLAAHGPTNQEKSDGTPERWMPPNVEAHCTYGIKYTLAAIQWDLPLTTGDLEVLRSAAKNCS